MTHNAADGRAAHPARPHPERPHPERADPERAVPGLADPERADPERADPERSQARAPSRRARAAGDRARAAVAQAGLREPVVLILLLIGFFSAISGKPLDGLFMLVVAAGLAWDAGKRFRAGIRQAAAGGGSGPPDELTPPDPAGWTAAWRRQAPGQQAPGRRSRLLGAAAVAGGTLYAVLVGSFPRYSWPATVGVVGLGAVVLCIGWRGPLRIRRIPPVPSRLGAALWGGLLVAGGLWELTALLEQPSLATSSGVHPTISTLTDPLLASPAGRAVALAIWLVLGCFLVLR